MADIGWRRGASPAARRGARQRAGLTPASASNTLSCQRETLHSQQLKSIKKSIDSDHGIYRDPPARPLGAPYVGAQRCQRAEPPEARLRDRHLARPRTWRRVFRRLASLDRQEQVSSSLLYFKSEPSGEGLADQGRRTACALDFAPEPHR